MLSSNQVPLILVAVLLLKTVALPQIGASPVEEEAYYQVDVLLAVAESQDNSNNKDIYASVKGANDLLQSTLAELQQYLAPESSNSAEIRGETIDLLEKLISLYQMVEKKEQKGAFYAISEEIGTKLVDVWRVKSKLTHLENYLVKLVSLIEENSDNKKGNDQEKSWFRKFLDKLGL